ncbi:MAG: helix-turn-helix domain-containing protein [Peptoniphilus sp.]|nr:helix-turn-helix domain-containing protein [Peptoniphilus sp.]MDY3118341.1 helix-turn-helix domain-containing protein [Peptoniphilus sp.]
MSGKFSGQKIRTMRKALGMSIKDLAEASNLSTGLISQIERDLVSPSVNAMLRIVDALHTTMGEFFEDVPSKKKPTILRGGEHTMLESEAADRRIRLLSPKSHVHYEIVEMRFETAEKQDVTPTTDDEGEAFGFLLAGRLTVVLDDVAYALESGDSIAFDRSAKYAMYNEFREPCLSLWLFLPPIHSLKKQGSL